MRTVYIELGGVSYPMCFTLRAFSAVCERYGDLSSCLKKLDELVAQSEQVTLIQEYLWLLSTLLDAAFERDGYLEDVCCPPQLEDLQNLFTPGEVVELQRKVLETITLGNAREVGAEPPKNGDGAGA